MRWSVLFELPPEDVARSWPTEGWTLHPRFMRDDGVEEDGRLFWTVGLTHRHGSKLEHCNLANREEVIRDGMAAAEYNCTKCWEQAPESVVRAKQERQQSLKGTDPLNNRRGAVLATREMHEHVSD